MTRVWLCLLFLIGSLRSSASEKILIAVAANFAPVIDALNAGFSAREPDAVVSVTLGASGNLVAQIRAGAPFDVFLSADLGYPRALIEAGAAGADSLTPFARGRLVLWTTRTALPFDSIADALRDPAVRKVAISNPATTPYGRAAMETLDSLHLRDAVAAKIVTGENIAQTAQFVETGHADVGFVAMSFVLAPGRSTRGRWIEVPADRYAPIDQAAIVTKHGRDQPLAKRYVEFLRSDAARAVLTKFGYGIPE